MDDKEIVNRILYKGDTQNYREIVHRYRGKIFPKVMALLRDEDWAAEVTQQVFVRAYTSLSTWSGENLSAWLMTISYHQAINALNQQRKRQRDVDSDEADISDEPYSEEHEQLLQRMEAALDTLPEQDKTILKLHYYKGVQTDEIAKRLGMTQANVLMKLHRLRDRLKKQLENETDD